MAKKKFWLVMLAMVLVLGIALIGCDGILGFGDEGSASGDKPPEKNEPVDEEGGRRPPVDENQPEETVDRPAGIVLMEAGL
jgi:hypothetical protein